MHVVDRDEHVPVAREVAQECEERDRHRPLLERSSSRLVEEERDAECVPLRRREPVDLIRGGVHEIADRRERQLRLRLRGLCAKDEPFALQRARDTVPPQRRLSDAGLALEQKRARSVGVEELLDRRHLALPAGQLLVHGPWRR